MYRIIDQIWRNKLLKFPCTCSHTLGEGLGPRHISLPGKWKEPFTEASANIHEATAYETKTE